VRLADGGACADRFSGGARPLFNSLAQTPAILADRQLESGSATGFRYRAAPLQPALPGQSGGRLTLVALEQLFSETHQNVSDDPSSCQDEQPNEQHQGTRDE
jgi:hypothetical protein